MPMLQVKWKDVEDPAKGFEYLFHGLQMPYKILFELLCSRCASHDPKCTKIPL